MTTTGGTEHVSVLVIGAGPAGLTLAMDLGQRGVDCLVVEATEERSANPRCNTTSARSMEIFRRLGIAREVRRTGLPGDYPTSVQYRTTMLGEEIYRLDLPSSAEVEAGVGARDWPTPEPQHRISQLFLEPVLEQHALDTPGVTLRRGTRLLELRQHDDRVEAVLGADGHRWTVTCDYAVGCDGAHSTVRSALGIRYEGVEAIKKFVSTLVRSPELGRIAAKDRAWTYWTYGRRPAALIAIDGGELWLNHVAFDVDQDTEREDPARLLDEAVGGVVDHEALGTVRWTGRQLVARHYRKGRVFLAGDAAHIWIPAGGFGMNAGIQDAATLAWMLSAVHQGWAPPSLLDAYETERKPVGEQFAAAVGATARASLAGAPAAIHLDGPAGVRAREDLARRLAATEAHRYSPDGFSFGYHYAGSPLVVGGSPQPLMDMGSYPDEARAGFRLPHSWLPDGRSILDVVGPGFTLVRTDASADAAAWAVAAERLSVPLDVVDVRPERPERYRAPLLLVRPDQHVAWLGGSRDEPAVEPGAVLRAAVGRS
ncbi:FAD-dependent monooxygenase [Myceligenerans indicum]|uniref:FAD-binding protein n=1 Tax=Myceligenerans indicum TaxID=2593663 RepID=A0ABS1LI74_9MICO|nr:FAD-dependent monooxygenase [Myceligenerans indicum]MBL0885916.1 FAD-binding protein [Myceligenerans indicum]